jgi:hypothetical protein
VEILRVTKHLEIDVARRGLKQQGKHLSHKCLVVIYMKLVKLVAVIGFMAKRMNSKELGTSITEYVQRGNRSISSLIISALCQVFKKIEKQLPQLTTLDLQYVSPELLKARNLDLAVPGMPIFQFPSPT